MSGGASVSKAGRWGRGAEGVRHDINPTAILRFRTGLDFFAGDERVSKGAQGDRLSEDARRPSREGGPC